MEDDGGRSSLGFLALFASPLFHSGRQPSNSQSESKATAKATINFGESGQFRSGSHFGEEQPFAIVVNTAPDEFLFIGANGDPAFTIESGAGKVFIASKDEGRYENGKWIAGRRINGDEMFESGLPKTKLGMLKVKLVRAQ